MSYLRQFARYRFYFSILLCSLAVSSPTLVHNLERPCAAALSDESSTQGMWQRLSAKTTDATKIAALQTAFSLANDFPAEKIPELERAFDKLLAEDKSGDALTDAAVEKIDLLEKAHRNEMQDAWANARPTKPTPKAELSAPSNNINDLLSRDGEIKLLPEKKYTVSFQRPDPRYRGPQSIKFSEKVCAFLEKGTHLYPTRRWLEVISMGIARGVAHSGWVKPISATRVYDFEIKVIGDGQKYRLGVVRLSDGTFYIRDVYSGFSE